MQGVRAKFEPKSLIEPTSAPRRGITITAPNLRTPQGSTPEQASAQGRYYVILGMSRPTSRASFTDSPPGRSDQVPLSD